MSEKHLAERLMYPLPDGWRDDPEQVAALKEIWPKIITKNKELIDAEITSLRAQLDEARRKAIEECAAIADDAYTEYWRISNEHEARWRAWRQSGEVGEMPTIKLGPMSDFIAARIRALLSESKS